MTLTYDDKHLPTDLGLVVSHWQLFMKRLRKHTKHYYESRGLPVPKLRYLHSGEYGEENRRPHYHAILFGEDFSDARVLRPRNNGNPLWTSPVLDRLWPYGFHTIGEVTFASCAYVARYALKKINAGKTWTQQFSAYPSRLDSDTGEIKALPPYATMSRRNGLGWDYFNRYYEEFYLHDNIVIEGKKWPVPRRYDKWLKDKDETLWEAIMEARTERAIEREKKRERAPSIDHYIREHVAERRQWAADLKRDHL